MPDRIPTQTFSGLDSRDLSSNSQILHKDGLGFARGNALSLPISTAAQSALNLKANDSEVLKLSGAQSVGDIKTFTSIPVLPASDPTSNNQAARKAYVDAAISNLVNASPAALDTLNELAAALGNDANFATTITNALSLKAPLNSPAFTGVSTAPTAAVDTDTTQLATTAFAKKEADDAQAAAIAASVPTARTLTAAGLVTGGGNLTTDRTITVTESADAAVLNETVSTTAVTPRRWWQRLAFWLADTTAKTIAGPLTLLSNLTVNGSDIRLPSGGAAFVDGASVATRDRGDARFFAMVAQFEEGAATVSIGAVPTGGPLVWTWTIPDGYRGMIVDIIGGGGGGGAGRRGAADSNRFGGGGGGAGAWNRMTVEIGTLASRTITITLGAGGEGGIATATDDTNGAPGTGNNSTLISIGAALLLHAYGGLAASAGGTNVNGLGANAASGSMFLRRQGDNGTTAAAGSGSFDFQGITGGAGGAGLSATNTPAKGGQGSVAMKAMYPQISNWIAAPGLAPGGNAPTAGIAIIQGGMHAGQGGGSGASNVGGTGGDGGDGRRGGGGGGGGASQNGFASGAGGAGGAGFVRIICY